MKKIYLKLLTLVCCLGGGATTMNAAGYDDYEWNFTDNSLWNGTLTTGYYTPTGGSTVSETEPTDSKFIYVRSTKGLTLSSGSHYVTKPNTVENAAAPANDYIKLYVPAGYTINVSAKLSANSWANTFHLLIKDSEDEKTIQDITTTSTSWVECKYKNEGTTVVAAYVFNVAKADRQAHIQSIKLTENGTVAHKYTVKFTDGENDLQEAISGECIETETYTVNVPKVIVKDNAYYVLDNSDDRKDFRETYTMGAADETRKVKYTKDENVVFFEDYSGSKNDAASGGSVKGNLSQKQSFTVCDNLPAGQYEFSANKFFYGQGRTENFMIDGNTVATVNKSEGVHKVTFNLAAAGNVSIGVGNSTSDHYDYALICKIGEAVTQKTVEISAAGYATYVTEYAMDFTNSEVEAYVISGIDMANSKVTLEMATKVPAGQAVIVKGSTANVPVCNSAAAVTNLLEHSADDIAYPADAKKTYYVLAKEGDKVVFAPVTSGTIAAGKGYFTVDKGAAANAASFRLSFGPGTPTAVDEVQAESGETAKAAYNMAGQRVSANAKGIVIINGKKTYRIQ